ncbi:MAG: hypothetical protein QM778_25920 [Myxococcales bacterium]
MDKRFWMTAFSLALSLAGSACSEVDHCKPGDDGCIGGSCMAGANCEFDLACVAVGAQQVCGKELDVGYDCGEDLDCKNATPVNGDGDGDAVPCNCTGGALCVPGTSDQCINYCEEPGTVPVANRRQEVLPCRTGDDGQPVTYQNACKALWTQFCLRAPVYCPGYICDPNFYSTQKAQDWCMQFYPTLADVSGYCETLRDSTCETFTECDAGMSEDPAMPTFPKNCANVGTCKNTCPGNPNFTNDGSCDDGDVSTAAFGVCDWGTDCGDCGPRLGTPPTLPLDIGALCVGHQQCRGYTEDLRNNKSWCLSVGDSGVYRCMPDCTLGDNCGEGYKCTTLVDSNQDPITQGDLEAKVCDPQICM